MPKLTQENTMFDIPDLNRFRIGDEVIVDASEDNDRFEGTIIGIELRRSVHGGPFETDITLLHDDYVTDGFKPADCRKVKGSPVPSLEGALAAIEAVWKCSLVIESSARRGDGPIQYAEVLHALKLVKEVHGSLSAPSAEDK